MKKRILLGCSLFLTISLVAQVNPTAQKYAATINEADLKESLTILASDAMEGRETGKRGQKMAAAFIAAYFEDLGLSAPVQGSYYQPVPLYNVGAPEVYLKAGSIEISKDEYAYSGSQATDGLMELPFVFVGKGTEAEIGNVQITGKAVAVILDGNSPITTNPVVASLREKGAKVIFVTLPKEEDFLRTVTRVRNFSGGRLTLSKPTSESANAGLFFISYSALAKGFNTTVAKLEKSIADKKVNKLKPSTVTFSITPKSTEVKSENILGFLEGTDKKDEVVVITAHYDHIGISSRGEGDKINNGADDDGSGTVAVLEMAQAFMQAKKDGHGPRRSILFMTVTGEEKGLLGSSYYSEHPVFPLDKTVVDLNIDMIGRRDPQHKDSAPYVYVIGSDRLSSELHALSESTNKTYTNLIFDYLYNAEDHPDRIYYRSDHWNFAKKNIPIIFYFDGIHEDYHKPSDEVDKIEFDLLALRARNVFHVAWEIANRENKLIVDKGEKK